MTKNTKARFSNATKELIYERDNGVCFKCWANSNLQFHHILFGTESIYTKNRNNVEMWVTICDTDHNLCHWCSKWEWIRQEAIDFVNNLYN